MWAQTASFNSKIAAVTGPDQQQGSGARTLFSGAPTQYADDGGAGPKYAVPRW